MIASHHSEPRLGVMWPLEFPLKINYGELKNAAFFPYYGPIAIAMANHGRDNQSLA